MVRLRDMSKEEAVAALQREIDYHQQEIVRLERAIELIRGKAPATAFSNEGRQRISEAQKRRWAKYRIENASSNQKKKP